MNNLYTDIGFQSLNKFGEYLCGDTVNVIYQDDNSIVVVLSDGLGSGVKASILSTITSKIISTMISEGLSIEECVSTMASTLPVCSVRGFAYSTFTIIKIVNNQDAEIIQYDSPQVILLRDGKNVELPTNIVNVMDKKISRSKVLLNENDVFLTISDGVLHAGNDDLLNLSWDRKDIIAFMETQYNPNFTAKAITEMLLTECNKLYEGEPRDDTTVCTIRIRKRESINILIGPPANPYDCEKMMSLFFSKEGKHILCGGTTSAIASDFLGKPLVNSVEFFEPDVPPISIIDGVDLVTEGIITISKVLQYAKSYTAEGKLFYEWQYKEDGASSLARMLFEEATDINFFVGRAKNPAHQNLDPTISFNMKMELIDELSKCLERMGKKIKLSYF